MFQDLPPVKFEGTSRTNPLPVLIPLQKVD